MTKSRKNNTSVQSRENLTSLPFDLNAYISSFLPAKDLAHLTQASKKLYGLFHIPLVERKLPLLLKYVMDGNPKAVANVLKLPLPNNKCIALEQVYGIEECGREWKISPFKFAVRAGDTEIIMILLKHIPKEMLLVAKEQLNDVLNDTTKDGKHLASYHNLIHAYDDYINKYDVWQNLNWDVKKRYNEWVKLIGQAQCQLPVVGLQLFCNGYIHQPMGSNKKTLYNLDRTLLINGASLLPFSSSGLGKDFVLQRLDFNSNAYRYICDEPPNQAETHIDKRIVQTMCDLRNQELQEVIKWIDAHIKKHECVIS